MPTTDDACTLTLTYLPGSIFPTLVQTSGWVGDISDNGVGGNYIMWDESDNGFISPRTNTFEERQIRVLWESAYYIAWLLNGPPPAVSPNNAALVVESCAVKGQVGSSADGYAQGMIPGTVGQSGYTYGVLSIRYTEWVAFTVETDFGIELLQITNAGPVFKWPDGTPLDPSEVPSIRMTTATYRVTRYDFLTVPDFTLYNGYVSNSPITIDGYVRPAGTMLMCGASTRTVYQITGQPYKVFEAVFKYVPVGWNNIFRASTGTFQAVRNNNGQPPYQSANLALFFTP